MTRNHKVLIIEASYIGETPKDDPTMSSYKERYDRAFERTQYKCAKGNKWCQFQQGYCCEKSTKGEQCEKSAKFTWVKKRKETTTINTKVNWVPTETKVLEEPIVRKDAQIPNGPQLQTVKKMNREILDVKVKIVRMVKHAQQGVQILETPQDLHDLQESRVVQFLWALQELGYQDPREL